MKIIYIMLLYDIPEVWKALTAFRIKLLTIMTRVLMLQRVSTPISIEQCAFNMIRGCDPGCTFARSHGYFSTTWHI